MPHTISLVEDNPDNRLLVHAILDDAFEIMEYADERYRHLPVIALTARAMVG